MFASLALTKMSCERLANFFMLPVFLALLYSNIAAYQTSPDGNQNQSQSQNNSLTSHHPESSTAKSDIETTGSVGQLGEVVHNQFIHREASGDRGSWDVRLTASTDSSGMELSIELALHNLLAVMALVQLLANMSSLKGSGSVSNNNQDALAR